MSASLCDQRVRIFTYSDTGTNGEPDSTYTFAAERWGRLEAAAAREGTTGAQAQHQAEVVVLFADEVTVTRDGALKVAGRFYKIDSIEPRRTTRELQVTATWVDDETLHVVDP